jgi:hypothetical protein
MDMCRNAIAIDASDIPSTSIDIRMYANSKSFRIPIALESKRFDLALMGRGPGCMKHY